MYQRLRMVMPMNSFSNLTTTAKAVEVLRWIGVLPVAVLCQSLYHMIVMALFLTKATVGGEVPQRSALVDFLYLLIYYPPHVALFVIAGAMVAPRFRLATAILLAVLAIALSLTIHVLLPDNVGVNNYKHFTAESAGAIGGLVFVFYWERRSRTLA